MKNQIEMNEKNDNNVISEKNELEGENSKDLTVAPNEPYFNKCWVKNKNLHKVFEYSDYLTKYTFIKRAIFSVMAGFCVGIAYLVYFICKSSFGNIAGPIVGSALFPFAIFAILFWGGNLFTSNTLMIMSVIRKRIKLSYYVGQLLLTYLFNLVGSLISMGLAWLFLNNHSSLSIKAAAVHTAIHKLETPWYSMLSSAFFCNILVAGCVYGYLVITSSTVKFLFVYLVIFFFAISGFQHCIANQFSITLGVSYFDDPTVISKYKEIYGAEDFNFSQSLGWGAFFLYNQIGVTLFNALSGILLPTVYMFAEYKKQNKTNNKNT